MKSYIPKKDEINRKWCLIDAEGKILGRLASDVAQRLRGKNNPGFVPYADTGDFVVVVNVEKIILTGKKLDQKVYYRHSGFIGGLKSITAKKLKEKRPEENLYTDVNLGRLDIAFERYLESEVLDQTERDGLKRIGLQYLRRAESEEP